MTSPIQSILDTTAERFDEKFYGETRPRRTALLSKDSELGLVFKSFIRAEQLRVLEAIQKIVKGMEEEDNYSTAYTDYTEKKAIENSKAILNYNHALKDVLSALDLTSNAE